jgi:hypothetical protein
VLTASQVRSSRVVRWESSKTGFRDGAVSGMVGDSNTACEYCESAMIHCECFANQVCAFFYVFYNHNDSSTCDLARRLRSFTLEANRNAGSWAS